MTDVVKFREKIIQISPPLPEESEEDGMEDE
jgi:hypothetical protein